MEDDGDIREHLRKFFDTIDKLSEMEVEINLDLLTIMLLYSLPSSFENFHYAIESRDELPTPEALRLQIVKESDARKNDVRIITSNAMTTRRQLDKRRSTKKRNAGTSKDDGFKYKCHR